MLTLVRCSTSEPNDAGLNIAVVADGTFSQVTWDGPITTLNDGLTDTNTGPVRMRPGQGQRPSPPLQTQWVQYEWVQPVTTGEIEVFWWDWEGTMALPQSYTISYLGW